jgi:hypothetical protein
MPEAVGLTLEGAKGRYCAALAAFWPFHGQTTPEALEAREAFRRAASQWGDVVSGAATPTFPGYPVAFRLTSAEPRKGNAARGRDESPLTCVVNENREGEEKTTVSNASSRLLLVQRSLFGDDDGGTTRVDAPRTSRVDEEGIVHSSGGTGSSEAVHDGDRVTLEVEPLGIARAGELDGDADEAGEGDDGDGADETSTPEGAPSFARLGPIPAAMENMQRGAAPSAIDDVDADSVLSDEKNYSNGADVAQCLEGLATSTSGKIQEGGMNGER